MAPQAGPFALLVSLHAKPKRAIGEDNAVALLEWQVARAEAMALFGVSTKKPVDPEKKP